MDMKELQEKLTEKKLNIFQQIKYTFFVFKSLIFDRNGVWWILFFFLIDCIKIIGVYLFQNTSLSPMLNLFSIFNFCYYLVLFLFYQKIIFKIEEKNYLRLGQSASKFFFLYFIYYIASYIGESFFPYLIFFDDLLLVFLAIYWIAMVIFWLYMFYFIPLFSARPFNLKESWNYNLHLMKRNWLKIIFFVITYLIFIFFTTESFLGLTYPMLERLNVVYLFFSTIFGTVFFEFFGTFILILFVILHCVIYLNVEYMDRKIK